MNHIFYTPDTVYLQIKIRAKKLHVEKILQYLYESISPTHKEDACLEYKILHVEKNIIIHGKWKNKMSLDMHLMFQYHLNLFDNILPPLCKKIDIKIYQEIEPPITALSLKDE